MSFSFKVVVFWVVVPCSWGMQQCSGYISMITNLSPEDASNTASETLVSNHVPTWRSDPENRDFYSPQ
jgi:hypothetical protein